MEQQKTSVRELLLDAYHLLVAAKLSFSDNKKLLELCELRLIKACNDIASYGRNIRSSFKLYDKAYEENDAEKATEYIERVRLDVENITRIDD